MSIDFAREFRFIHEMNAESRRLILAAYTPLRYALAHTLGTELFC